MRGLDLELQLAYHGRMVSGYCGAVGRSTLAVAERRGWCAQPKVDGVYARVQTDAHGAVVGAWSRAGRPLRIDSSGWRALPACAVLAGEWESHTESALAAVAERGYPVLHLFDLLELAGRDLAREPQRVRRDALLEALMSAEREALDRDGRRHDERGRYAERLVRGAVLVPQWPAEQLADRWTQYVIAGGGEGLVLVDREAVVGRGKAKIKPRDDLDVVVRRVRPSTVEAAEIADPARVHVLALGERNLKPGQVWEVRHSGRYRSGRLRFAALGRRRTDLAALPSLLR